MLGVEGLESAEIHRCLSCLAKKMQSQRVSVIFFNFPSRSTTNSMPEQLLDDASEGSMLSHVATCLPRRLKHTKLLEHPEAQGIGLHYWRGSEGNLWQRACRDWIWI